MKHLVKFIKGVVVGVCVTLAIITVIKVLVP